MATQFEQGTVRFEYRHRVLGNPQSQKAAEASECAADQGQFWAYHDKLMANQTGGFPTEKLKRFAGDLGLDTKAFNQCLDTGKYRKHVLEQTKEAEDRGINSTPYFELNGQHLELKQSFDEIAQAVVKELNK